MSGSEIVTVTMSLQFISGRQCDDLILAEPRPQFVMETTRHNNKIFDPRLAQTTKIYPPPVTALDMPVKNPIIKASCGGVGVGTYVGLLLCEIFPSFVSRRSSSARCGVEVEMS